LRTRLRYGRAVSVNAVEPKLCDYNNKEDGLHEGSDVPNTSSGVVLHWCWVGDAMCSVGNMRMSRLGGQ
jgi:hypothetical protein